VKNRLYALRSRIDQVKGRREHLTEQLQEARARGREAKREVEAGEKALVIVQEVSESVQLQIQRRISELGTLCLRAVFGDRYEMDVTLERRRNRIEADLSFVDNLTRARVDPLSATGGGPVDVAAFALRLSLWSLRQPSLRNVLVLDEPFRFLSVDLHERASMLMKKISEELGLQIIMVTHSGELTAGADKVFRVTMRNGVSRVTEE
jgi:DNA repair exonuclease SbcCD ATPase subunit